MPKLADVNHLDAVRALEKAGFHVRRQGKHIVMTDGTRIVTIPRHNPVHSITMGTICCCSRRCLTAHCSGPGPPRRLVVESQVTLGGPGR